MNLKQFYASHVNATHAANFDLTSSALKRLNDFFATKANCSVSLKHFGSSGQLKEFKLLSEDF